VKKRAKREMNMKEGDNDIEGKTQSKFREQTPGWEVSPEEFQAFGKK